ASARPADSAPAAPPPVIVSPPPAASGGSPVLTPSEPLPTTREGLLAELLRTNQELETLIGRGDLGAVWVPAIHSKDVALALEQHQSDVDPSRRQDATQAIKQLVLSAWQMDAAGDLGDKAKIAEAYAAFTGALAQITSAYAAR